MSEAGSLIRVSGDGLMGAMLKIKLGGVYSWPCPAASGEPRQPVERWGNFKRELASMSRPRRTPQLSQDEVTPINIGKRLLELRAARSLSQGDIEKRTGLLRCYVSRVENGHTTPSLETLQRWAQALEVDVYQLFFEGKGKPETVLTGAPEAQDKKEGELLGFFRRADKADRQLMLAIAKKMAKKGA
jgi:transcriptional regulator with XRE-family HTH domain